ncbi:Zinc finger protein ZFAT, partial [Tupaia chinensis]
TENTAIFMCKCCNLFSPNQSKLLSHVSEKHTEEGVNIDEIIIPLRPLSTPEPPNPGKTGDEFSVMKRKRGRPKGSTKKPSAEEELAENIVSPSEDSPLAPENGSSPAPGSLECSKCCRKFSNTRQLRKHICIIVLNLGEEEGEAGASLTSHVTCHDPRTFPAKDFQPLSQSVLVRQTRRLSKDSCSSSGLPFCPVHTMWASRLEYFRATFPINTHVFTNKQHFEYAVNNSKMHDRSSEKKLWALEPTELQQAPEPGLSEQSVGRMQAAKLCRLQSLSGPPQSVRVRGPHTLGPGWNCGTYLYCQLLQWSCLLLCMSAYASCPAALCICSILLPDTGQCVQSLDGLLLCTRHVKLLTKGVPVWRSVLCDAQSEGLDRDDLTLG